MQTHIRSFVPAVALGFLLTCSMAHAQLMLSGHTTGSFTHLGEANTTVTNAADGSSASFYTGIPVSGSTQSSIVFTNQSFVNVGSGDPIQVGLFTITNGETEIGSAAPTAMFNLGLDLTSPTMEALALAPITFSIDNTVNHPDSGVPDIFSVSYTQPAPVMIGGYLASFHINFSPAEFSVHENTTVEKGDVTVTFTAVPEPSTYAACGAALLLGLVAYRRLRAERGLPSGLAGA